MSIDQLLTEHSARTVPHWKRRKARKVIAPQSEFGFAADAFCLVGETLPPAPAERVQPELAASLFAEMFRTVANSDR